MLHRIAATILILVCLARMSAGYFKCTTDGFFADKSDCWVYHICDGGTHSVRACEEDLFFNPKTGLCDWPMNVECKQSGATHKQQTTGAKDSTSSTASEEDRKTTASFTAVDKHTTNRPGSGSGNNRVRLTTNANAVEAAVDLPAADTLCSSEDYGYMAHPKDCRKYIYCQEGHAKMFTCQGGLLWKQSDGNCVWPLDSDCPSLKKTTQAGTGLSNNNNNNNNNGNLAVFGSSVGGGGINQQLSSAQAAASALRDNYGTIECPSDMTGFLPNPYDCSAYHFCNGGKDQVVLCEPGLQYRHDKQVCDWPVNSNCMPKCPNNVDKFRFIDPKSCCRYFECVNGRLVVQLCQYPLLFDMVTKQCMDYSRVKCGIRKDCTSPCQYFANEDPSLCEMVPSCNGKPQGVYLDQNRANCQFFYSCRDSRVFNHTRCSGALRFNQFEGRCMAPSMVACDAASARAATSAVAFVVLSVAGVMRWSEQLALLLT